MPNKYASLLTILLAPISLLYGIGVWFRNQLFDWGILKSKHFPVPVICVGNLTAGGTGKTPHIEYLIKFLQKNYRVAVVSRGYQRKSKEYILATPAHSYQDLGDEPFLIKRKYPHIIVAVDNDRCRAIQNLMDLPTEERPEVILLDDGFQHRYVSPSFSILLTDYNRMFYQDFLLPLGRLREPVTGKQRADIVIVTKTPIDLKPIEYRIIETNMHLQAYQHVYFSYIRYEAVRPVFESGSTKSITSETSILALCGIASPQPFIEELEKWGNTLNVLTYPDHYDFKELDIHKIRVEFEKISNNQKVILTTEKDAVRLLKHASIPEELKPYLLYLPMEIYFQANRQKEFEHLIDKHLRTFQQNKI